MEASTYTAPQVKDYGTLLELTAHIDVNFVGAAANVVMAAMSSPIGGGGGVADNPSISHAASGGVGGVSAHGGGTGGGGGGLLSAARGGGGGGKLPFTGFPVVLLAAVGAMVASLGAVLRAMVRRPRRDDA
jgi:hypothetical protein